MEAFTECEPFRGPRSLGPLECFFTSGGTSTAPERLRGTLRTYEYKTIRYRGHFGKVRAMIDLGLLSHEPVEVDGRPVAPRALFHAAAGPRLDRGAVLLLLTVDGTDARGRGTGFRLLQRRDGRTGFSAMEMATGYPTAVVARDLALGRHAPGARTPDRLGYGKAHLADLRRRGVRVRRVRLG
jgi:lysine 6-dehydrogenase